MSNLTDPDRSQLVEARMILLGLPGLHPTKEHLEALKEHYDCQLIKLANDLDALKEKVLNL